MSLVMQMIHLGDQFHRWECGRSLRKWLRCHRRLGGDRIHSWLLDLQRLIDLIQMRSTEARFLLRVKLH